MFHDVPDVPRFRDFLDWLIAHYELLPMDQWLNASPTERTQLTLTFDDGYASWHDSLAAVLEERRLSAVFFVTPGLVGLQGADAREFARRQLRRVRELQFLSLAQLRDLAARPLFTIGSHTETHVDLGSLNDVGTIRREVEVGRSRLEEWLGREVRLFAYPFGTPGNISPLARTTVERAGMSAAFTLIPGWWAQGTGDPFLIGRDGPDPSNSTAVWRGWLGGGYDRLYTLKEQRRRQPIDQTYP